MKSRKKIVVVILSFGILAVILFFADNSKMLPRDEQGRSYVSRNHAGEGKRREELQVQVGELDEAITVEVLEEQLTKEEVRKAFEQAEKELDTWVLGENKTWNEIRWNLNLITELPGTGIAIAWESDNYEVMNQQGEICGKKLTEEGTLVLLTAVLTYGEEEARIQFHANVLPPKLTKKERIKQKLVSEMERIGEETQEEKKMALPQEVDGMSVEWRYVKEYRAAGIFLLGIVAALLLILLEQQKEKEALEQRKQQLQLAYPQMLNRFTLYMGAGMTARKAWFKLAEDYEKVEKKKRQSILYEEMVYTMHEMQSGVSEKECYERFGKRCQLTVYRKFATLLAQNLKKGTKGLTELLKQEAENAFEERKCMARRLGEEAGTKMLLPMFLMFGMVLAMIVVPAFFSMQL